MKDNKMISRLSALLLMVWVVSVCDLFGQSYKLGDLYTFDDGSTGIVFYVDPDDPGSGTVAALNDLGGQYALWTGGMPQTLTGVFSSNGGIFFNQIIAWQNHGKQFTQVLRESGVSPAANAIDVDAGWYIPDILQLQKLCSSILLLKDAFENNGGDIMTLWNTTHLSATRINNSSNEVYGIYFAQNLGRYYGTQSYAIRPVRDFPDTAVVQAYWVGNAPHSDTVVAPDTTQSYNALVIYRSDTMSLTATVTVHQPKEDTLYEAVYKSVSPYSSIVEPLFSDLDISLPGVYEYRDTLSSANGCDSIVVLKLTVGDNVRYTDTLCPLKTDFYFAPFDTVFSAGTVSGLYEHHGVKLVDGVSVDTVAYYELTILPEYQRFDTVRRCLYETAETWPYDGNAHVGISVNGTSVTVASDTDAVVVEEVTSGTDYDLKMQTMSGCDSVAHLHLDLRRVSRGTVYKDMPITQLVGGEATVACHTFTGITAPGTYAATDTLTSSNGCDSLMTVFLMVEPLRTETLCDSVLSADLTWTGNLSGYTWNGQPLPAGVGASGYYEFSGQKTFGGELVDTVSYLQLIVNQKYETKDTVSLCLYEPTFTVSYDLNSAVTITVDAGDGITVTSSDANVEVLLVSGSVTDFVLRMQTVNGCDSVVFLYMDVRRVSRDTVRHYAYMHQAEGERITVDGREFTNITGAGTYELHDTLVAANGCDSVVLHELTVEACASGFTILCPPDIYDTLVYGDCAMTIYPDRIGAATVQYDMAWPFAIGNNMPADNLFAQGDNVITWTATDLACGSSVSCEQHVFVAFPQCPDAVDFEGNIYHGVRVGCDCWTQRNLESKKYSDGADILGRYAYANAQYPDTTANVALFGRLYSYEAAVRDSADNGHGHVQGICPKGWYLPTPEKYEGLNAYGADALRSPDYWIVGAGNNSTGFTALPAGFYNGELDRYEGLLTETYFWSTKSVFHAKPKYLYSITYYCDFVSETHSYSGIGYSVRCVKEK
ncbi:MAG: fibrobacter succinogenes major paralogous domain-containing protein [Bacteroidales bacterium]|nr:fibrobacter succinogenes major paralogous domain-containing protein [Bacteroidales bacterium]